MVKCCTDSPLPKKSSLLTPIPKNKPYPPQKTSPNFFKPSPPLKSDPNFFKSSPPGKKPPRPQISSKPPLKSHRQFPPKSPPHSPENGRHFLQKRLIFADFEKFLCFSFTEMWFKAIKPNIRVCTFLAHYMYGKK
ncbi:MAG: hypothetical protein IFNCLDLE_00262 [Ignavibacteriaceae bacterium]|nr:hypothetical protein [Ignavibacteriaceae bacterium]